MIFADETVLSYIPFLLVHYSDIAIIDVEHATPEDLAAVKLEDYNQVLIGVSVDTFMHEDMHTVLSSYLPPGRRSRRELKKTAHLSGLFCWGESNLRADYRRVSRFWARIHRQAQRGMTQNRMA